MILRGGAGGNWTHVQNWLEKHFYKFILSFFCLQQQKF